MLPFPLMLSLSLSMVPIGLMLRVRACETVCFRHYQFDSDFPNLLSDQSSQFIRTGELDHPPATLITIATSAFVGQPARPYPTRR